MKHKTVQRPGRAGVERESPMKRGLKFCVRLSFKEPANLVERESPMKRGLKCTACPPPADTRDRLNAVPDEEGMVC